MDTVLPCELACPKCGDTDVLRHFYAKGAIIKKDDYNRCDNRFASGQCYSYTAWREHIDHHCRCCQYRWQTPPRKKVKAVPVPILATTD